MSDVDSADERALTPQVRLLVDRLIPPSALTKRVAWAIAWGLVLCIIGLVFVPWQQNVRGEGRVIAYTPLDRPQTIQSPITGRVVRWYVREGQLVRKDDPLVELSDNDPLYAKRLENERDALRARFASYEERASQIGSQAESVGSAQGQAVEAAAARLQLAEEHLTMRQQELAASQVALDTAVLNLIRHRALFAQGLESQRDLELAQLDEANARTKRDAQQAAVRGATQEVSARRADLAKARADAMAAVQGTQAARGSAQADVESTRAALQRIEAELSRQELRVVRAPRAGAIVRLLAFEGSHQLDAGDPIALLVPDTKERAVELWLDGNDVAIVSPGREVRLQFEGWPAVQFSGWPQVAVGTFGGRVAFIDAVDDGSGNFRVIIVPKKTDDPWPSPRFLRQGVRANGWVLLDQVPFGYELWRRFNGFPPSVQHVPQLVSMDDADSKPKKKKKAAGSKDEDGAEKK